MQTRTHIRLTEPIRAQLKALSERSGLTVSDIIRRAVEAWLKEHKA